MNLQQEEFDAWFPTLVRYTGLLLSVILVFACLLGYAVQAAPGFAVAGGMLLYKTVHNAAKPKRRGDDDADGEG